MMKWLKTNWFYLVVLVIALALPLVITNRYYSQVITMSLLFAIGALSLNLILGFTGQMSLAHGAFFAIGAYGVAILTYTLGWNFWLALPASALLAAFIGFLVGMPALRTRGSYFAITTMCLGEIIYLIAGNWMELTGGHNGIVGIPVPSPIAVPGVLEITFQSQASQYYLVLFFLLLTVFVMHRLTKSLRGMTFLATALNEDLSEAVGINTFRTKLLSFIVANFFAALAGGIYASLIGSISPSVASLTMTFNFLMFVLLGGITTLAGPIIGAFIIPILLEYLQFLQDYQMILFGFLLIVVIIYFPTGFMGLYAKVRDKIKKSKVGA
ncbi:MAG TPA: branched-chain amino acid ABC transporter permease [Smithellaceae bacterium]|nr:MAG: leucine/isoleucine/valine transporter permease subunit [Deltaproteobacteria bacterium ADurb.Bin002]HOD63197.1 branched-chain amino acid ABC transporter permease [Smithellaceae bacterium]HPI51698.1 branched-chain amino acid ABC transporter permease [Smithellaceae bacterium]HPO22011.1 branched-chain amino acid ABC transporter permease [Smithellaceae bacterium]HQK91024.1 branched-chain amino acid ABC transporter permease [Smithellaceae bacterium]